MKKILIGLLLALIALPVSAAVTPNSVVTAQATNLGVVQFLQGTDSAGTYKTLYTGGANGSIIKGLISTTNDGTVIHVVTCQIVRSTVKYGGTAVSVPLNSGFSNVTPAVNLMSTANWTGLPLDSDGNPFIFLTSADTLQCTFGTTLTTSTVVNVVAIAADF